MCAVNNTLGPYADQTLVTTATPNGCYRPQLVWLQAVTYVPLTCTHAVSNSSQRDPKHYWQTLSCVSSMSARWLQPRLCFSDVIFDCQTGVDDYAASVLEGEDADLQATCRQGLHDGTHLYTPCMLLAPSQSHHEAATGLMYSRKIVLLAGHSHCCKYKTRGWQESQIALFFLSFLVFLGLRGAPFSPVILHILQWRPCLMQLLVCLSRCCPGPWRRHWV